MKDIQLIPRWWRQPLCHLYLWPRITFTMRVSPPFGGSMEEPWYRRLHWRWKA